MREATIVRRPCLDVLIAGSHRILLVNSPAVDVRLPWARWQQPIGLLKIGAALRARGCEARLIDCLAIPAEGRLARERAGQVDVEGRTVDVWRFGLSPTRVVQQVREWRTDGWVPDAVFVSCGVSTWWQGARDVVSALRAAKGVEPRIVLGGAYPTFYPEHARMHVAADVVVVGDVAEAQGQMPDLELYRPGALPRFAGIQLYAGSGVGEVAVAEREAGPGGVAGGGHSLGAGCHGEGTSAKSLTTAPRVRPPEEIADEVEAKAKLGVTTFAFFDSWLGPDCREGLGQALEAIARNGLRNVGFVAIGNLSPRAVDVELARLLRRARFRQVFLHDDVRHAPSRIKHLTTEAEYAQCVRALHEAGFRQRQDEIGAAALVGVPGEACPEVAGRIVRLASVVGSVNLVPYQYTPGTEEGHEYERWLALMNGHDGPSERNAQIYPLARLAGASFENYVELTRLAALLNSKHHSRTFDFLGSGLIARLVRTSLRDELWNPFQVVPETVGGRTS